MARINIEECWWSDPRRSKLIRLIGDEERADGTAIKMWRTAQEFWKRDHQLVPRSVFEALQFASELLQSGLAEEREGSIYVRGSSQYLEWVKDAAEAGRLGGLKSAQTRREKYGSAQPKDRSKPEGLRSASEAPEPSVSGSVSGSKDLKHEQRKRRSSVNSDFDLEKLYQGYPRKKGKTPGLLKLEKTVLSEEDYEQLAIAIDNYAKDQIGKDRQFALHFSTFAGQWRDWVDVEPDAEQFSINTKPIDLGAL